MPVDRDLSRIIAVMLDQRLKRLILDKRKIVVPPACLILFHTHLADDVPELCQNLPGEEHLVPLGLAQRWLRDGDLQIVALSVDMLSIFRGFAQPGESSRGRAYLEYNSRLCQIPQRIG